MTNPCNEQAKSKEFAFVGLIRGKVFGPGGKVDLSDSALSTAVDGQDSESADDGEP